MLDLTKILPRAVVPYEDMREHLETLFTEAYLARPKVKIKELSDRSGIAYHVVNDISRARHDTVRVEYYLRLREALDAILEERKQKAEASDEAA